MNRCEKCKLSALCLTLDGEVEACQCLNCRAMIVVKRVGEDVPRNNVTLDTVSGFLSLPPCLFGVGDRYSVRMVGVCENCGWGKKVVV